MVNAVIHHRDIIIGITEIHHHNVKITMEVPIETIHNNTNGEGIIDHIHHSVMEINIARPEANTIIDSINKINRVTVLEATIGADHHVEECSPTAGRLVMTKEVIELVKTLKK